MRLTADELALILRKLTDMATRLGQNLVVAAHPLAALGYIDAATSHYFEKLAAIERTVQTISGQLTAFEAGFKKGGGPLAH